MTTMVKKQRETRHLGVRCRILLVGVGIFCFLVLHSLLSDEAPGSGSVSLLLPLTQTSTVHQVGNGGASGPTGRVTSSRPTHTVHFIDIGAYTGDTFLSMLHNHTFLQHADQFNRAFLLPQNNNDHGHSNDKYILQAYLVEANPLRTAELRQLAAKHRDNVALLLTETAVADQRTVQEKGGYMEFAITPNEMGASLYRAKELRNKAQPARPATVALVDICHLLQHVIGLRASDEEKGKDAATTTTTTTKTVVLKVDIEGGEYTLLERMLAEGGNCLHTVDAVYVEWHPWGQKEVYGKEACCGNYLEPGRNLTERFQEAGVFMTAWH